MGIENEPDEPLEVVSVTPESTSENKPVKLPEAFVAAQWKPGQSGNPGGRPSNPFKPEILKQLDTETLGRLIRKVVDQALEGDEKARRFIAEYTTGKPALAQEDRDALEKSDRSLESLAIILGVKK